MEKNKVVTKQRKRALRSAVEASARLELAQPDSSGNRRPLPGQIEFSVTRTTEFHGDKIGTHSGKIEDKIKTHLSSILVFRREEEEKRKRRGREMGKKMGG